MISQAMPASIRLAKPLNLTKPMGEQYNYSKIKFVNQIFDISKMQTPSLVQLWWFFVKQVIDR